MRSSLSPEYRPPQETISDRLKNARTLAEIFVALKGANQILDAKNKPLKPQEMIDLIQALHDEIEETKQFKNEDFPTDVFEKTLGQIPDRVDLRGAVRRILSPHLKREGRSTDDNKVPVPEAEQNPSKENGAEKENPTPGYSGQEMPEHLKNRPVEDQFLLANDIAEMEKVAELNKLHITSASNIYTAESLKRDLRLPKIDINTIPENFTLRHNFFRIKWIEHIDSVSNLSELGEIESEIEQLYNKFIKLRDSGQDISKFPYDALILMLIISKIARRKTEIKYGKDTAAKSMRAAAGG